MSDQTGSAPEFQGQPERDTPEWRLLVAAYGGDLYGIESALKQGADINAVHQETGLSPLHMAVGANDLALCRALIEKYNAGFFPDSFGRWPTLIAAECHVSDELSDYIVQKESEFLASQSSS
jgi:ankyrin repeat protein